MSAVNNNNDIIEAIKNNQFEQVKYLIQIQPSLLQSPLDEQGNTLLHLACKYQSDKIVLYFIEKGFENLLYQENYEKLSAYSFCSSKLKGMIKATLEINKIKLQLMEKYNIKVNNTNQQQQSLIMNNNLVNNNNNNKEEDLMTIRAETERLFNELSLQSNNTK